MYFCWLHTQLYFIEFLCIISRIDIKVGGAALGKCNTDCRSQSFHYINWKCWNRISVRCLFGCQCHQIWELQSSKAALQWYFKMFFFLLRPSIANAVDIKACLKIAGLYDFIKPSMPKLSKNQNSWKYAKTITGVANRRIKSTVGSHLRWEQTEAYGLAIIFSSVSERNVFSGEMIVCSANYSREEIGTRVVVFYNRRMNLRISLLAQSPICRGLTRRYIYIYRLTDFASTDTTLSKQSIYKFNRAVHCNWIRGATDSERASRSLPRQRIYISILSPGFTRARATTSAL